MNNINSRNFRRECARILRCGRLRAFGGDGQSTMAGVTRYTTTPATNADIGIVQPLQKRKFSQHTNQSVDVFGNGNTRNPDIELLVKQK